MTIDRSEPLIGFQTKERIINEPTLGLEWVTAKELTDLAGTPLERTFSELFYGTELELIVSPGAPTGSPDAYAWHYQLKSELIESLYTGRLLHADGGPEAQYNDFYGWTHNANVNLRTELWTDTLVTRVVWQLMSRPDENTLATDRIYTFGADGTIANSTTESEPESILIAAGRLWGLRYTQSEADFTVEMNNSSGEVQNTFTAQGNCATQQPTVPGEVLPSPNAPNSSEVGAVQPHALTHAGLEVFAPEITRPVVTESVYNPTTMLNEDVVVIRVVAEVHLFLYGAYWLQELEFVNSYHQGILLHPEGTDLATRLKPPGKVYLSDAYNKVQGTFTPNAEWR